jgi:hypothetical protein
MRRWCASMACVKAGTSTSPDQPSTNTVKPSCVRPEGKEQAYSAEESCWYMFTGSAEGDGSRVEAGGDAGRRLDVEDDELAVGAEAEVVERPPQCVHALLAAVHRHHHARQVPRRHGWLSCSLPPRLFTSHAGGARTA